MHREQRKSLTSGTVVPINWFILREVCTKGEENEASRMVAGVGGCVLSEVHAEKEETGEHWAYNTVCSVTWEMRVKKMLSVKNGIRS
jgi:hypothetical protein